jgi:hypothetical protein
LIVIFVPYRKPVMVFETTKDAIGLMATDSSATATHTSSIPPGLLAGDFETCWDVLTKDLQCARHFETVKEALAFLSGPTHGLTIQQHAAVVTALMRIDAKRSAQRQG